VPFLLDASGRTPRITTLQAGLFSLDERPLARVTSLVGSRQNASLIGTNFASAKLDGANLRGGA
jgi:uncharacterized protein YjbI with pentapeptide repeats